MGYLRSIASHTRSDFDGRLLGVDPLFCDLLQMTEGDLIGRDVLDLTHPFDREDTQVDMRRLRDEGRSFQIDKRYMRPDGSTIWAEVHADIISSSSGEKYIAGRIFLIEPQPLLIQYRAQSAAVHNALSRLAQASTGRPQIRKA